MNITLLTSIGFNEKTASIYLAALSLGTASIQDIAKKADIKRPTTYNYIQELVHD